MSVGTRRRGFTLPGVLATVLTAAIVARVVLPVYDAVRLKARAEVVVEEIRAIRDAAYRYRLDTGRWPEDRDGGRLPPELEGYLGDGFPFGGEAYQLDWENWSLPDGTPERPDVRGVLGVSVVTADARLGRAIQDGLSAATVQSALGYGYTIVIMATR